MRIKINYDEILDTALKGVRRTVAFMGLGVNAALDPEFKKYSLTGIAQIQLLPADLGAEAIEDIKTHFLTWVVGCGLRELIETFGVFLDQIFQVSSQIAIVYENYDAKQAEKDVQKFSYDGVSKKLTQLRDKFDIGPKHPSYIESINQARNCLTHRRGIVGYRDFNSETSLVIKWIGSYLIIKTEKGEEILLDLTSKESVTIDGGEGGSTIALRFVERELNYQLGDLVSIPPKSLAEICFFMTGESKEILRLAVDYAKRVGVQIDSQDSRSGSNPSI